VVTRGLATLVAALCAAVGVSTTASAHADGDAGGAVLRQINAMRAANGCGPLAANPQLTASASRHARDMLDNGVQDHTGSDGSSLTQRVTDAGYTPYAQVGEIVYWTTDPASAPAAAVAWWMNSPDHRAIITDCALTDAGFSAVSNGQEMTAAGDLGTR
jgi:uncharacterized protein YkwD